MTFSAAGRYTIRRRDHDGRVPRSATWPDHAQAMAAMARRDEPVGPAQLDGETAMNATDMKATVRPRSLQKSRPPGRPWFVVLIVLLMAASPALAQNRSPCAGNRDCTGAQQCRAYSSSTHVECNAVGRMFGCTRDAGMCSLFCSSEVLRSLRCTSSCTTDAQCPAVERCAGTAASGRFCVRR